MKRHTFTVGIALTAAMFVLLLLVVSQAQRMGPSEEMIKGAYRDILAKADKNRDGKLSQSECLAVWKDRQKGEKDCRYWDADADGVITEEEYVKQVRKLMR